MDIYEKKATVYTALSRHLFYSRMLISKFVLEQEAVPLNPFNLWGYFLYELVDRDLVRRGNNNVIRLVDEVWVFGPISDGVLAEIKYAIRLGKKIRFFSAGSKYEDIKLVDVGELDFEPNVIDEEDSRAKFIEQIRGYLAA
jgi:hypothetical protein